MTTAIISLIVICVSATLAQFQCGSSLKPEKLVVVGVWKRSFDNSTAQYRISDEDLSVRGYERANTDRASSTVMLARHPERCVITECGVRLSAMMQVNGAILHTDRRNVRFNDSTMSNIEDEFYCAEKNNSCGADVPVYRFVKHSLTGPHYAYSFDNVGQSLPGYEKEYFPLCFAWRQTPSVVLFNSSDDGVCLTLSDTNHGKITYSNNQLNVYSIGTTATLHCNHGFVNDGQSSLLCTKEGWYPKGGLGNCLEHTKPQLLVAASPVQNDGVSECQIPSSTPNGNIIYSANVATITSKTSVPTATRATVLCSIGYIPTNSAPSSKCVNGEWQPNLPSCVSLFELKCPILSAPRNGELVFANSSSSPYGLNSVILLKCDRNFYGIGNSAATCTSTGWDQKIGRCEAVGIRRLSQSHRNRYRRQISTGVACAAIATPANGNILFMQANPTVEYSSGTSGYLMCNLGYSLSGSVSTMCTNGVWSPTIGQCTNALALGQTTGNCEAIPAITSGTITYSSIGTYPSGTTATLSCNLMNTVTGSTTSTCLSGVWNPPLGNCVGGSAGGTDSTGTTCTNPTVINGVITYSQGNTYDLTRPALTVATLMCNSGYTLSGDSTSTCTNGVFTPTLGTCNYGAVSTGTGGSTTTSCMNPILIGGVLTYSQGNTYDIMRPAGTTVTLACSSGYTLSGNSQATCTNGAFTPALGNCNYGSSPGDTTGTIQCTAMIAPLGGSVTYSNGGSIGPFPSGTTVTGTCTSGQISGASTATCSNGMWTPTFLGTCSLIGGSTTGQCSALTVPAGAQATYTPFSLSTTSFTSGTVATVTCTTGGSMLGTTTCTNGIWSPSITQTCSNSGTGTGTGQCTTLTRPAGETVSYDGQSSFATSFTSGTIARVTCSNGTQIGQTTCFTGAWTPPIITTCSGSSTAIGTQCIGVIVPTDSQVVYSDGNMVLHSAGTTATLTCLNAATLTGNSYATCSEGVWTPTLGSCSSSGTSTNPCYTPPLTPTGATVTYSSGYFAPWTTGSTATMSCPSGQVALGNTISYCTNAAWSPAFGSCSGSTTGIGQEPISTSCPFGIAPVLGATMTYSNDNPVGPYPPFTIVTATCQSGYVPNGIMTSTCSNGIWAPASLGTCELMGNEIGGTSCGRLGDPLSGTLVYSAIGLGPYPSGTSATVLCNIGSTLSGSPSAICTNGVWNPLPGTCVQTFLRKSPVKSNNITLPVADSPKEINSNVTIEEIPKIVLSGETCPPPMAPAFGEITFSGLSTKGMFDDGTTAALKCNLGYKSTGPSFSTCRKGSFRPIMGKCSNGAESSSLSVCVPLSPPKNSRVVYIQSGSSLDFEDGTTALLYCEEGFAVTGTATLQCQSGQWEPSTGFGKCDSI